MSTKIHSTAIIDPSARLGKNVEVGPYSVIGPDVRLGDGCVVYSHAVIEYAELGPECRIFPHACVGTEPQHMKYKGEKTRLVAGARCVFREGVTAHRGTVIDKGLTTIGDDCYFMALSHVAHDCRIGNKVTFANSAQIAGHVEIGDWTFVSSGVGIHQFVRIGPVCMIGGGAMVSQDVAPFCIAQGDRAYLRGINVVGLRRASFDRTSMKLIREAYKAAFLRGFSLQDALAQKALQVDNPSVKSFREFLETSQRGFLRPPAGVTEDAESEVTA